MPPAYDEPLDIRMFIPPLRRCHHCNDSPDNNPTIQLKKCAGCSKNLYCSKACQKAEWPTHKAICVDTAKYLRSLPPITPTQPPVDISSFGYHSIASLCTAVQLFREAHEWSLSALAKTFIVALGGIPWSQNPQQIFTVEIVPVTTPGGAREHNPSRAFRVKTFYTTPVHEYEAANPLTKDEWVKGAPLRQAAFDTYGADPYYAGLLPVNLGIKGVNVTFMQYVPQFWPVPPSRPIPQLASEEAKKILMQDVAALAYCGINEGIPLRATGPEPPGVGLAYPGRFVRGQSRSASWSWEGLFSDWAEYRRGTHRGFDKLLDLARLRSSPPELMLALDSL